MSFEGLSFRSFEKNAQSTMVREGFKLSRPTRATLYLLAGGVILYVAAVAVMSTAWFHRFLLGRVTSSLESLTGAVEFGFITAIFARGVLSQKLVPFVRTNGGFDIE